MLKRVHRTGLLLCLTFTICFQSFCLCCHHDYSVTMVTKSSPVAILITKSYTWELYSSTLRIHKFYIHITLVLKKNSCPLPNLINPQPRNHSNHNQPENSEKPKVLYTQDSASDGLGQTERFGKTIHEEPSVESPKQSEERVCVCVCMCLCAYMHACVRGCSCVHVVYLCACMCVCALVSCMCVHVCACARFFQRSRASVCVVSCLCVCVCVCVCV